MSEPTLESAYFAAAADLYRAAPWKTLSPEDRLILYSDDPAIDGATICFKVDDGEVAVLLFASEADHDAFQGQIYPEKQHLRGRRPDCMAITYTARKETSKSFLKMLKEEGLPLASPDAIPLPTRIIGLEEPAPADEEVMHALSIAAEAAAAFWREHGAALREELDGDYGPTPRELELSAWDGSEVAISGPPPWGIDDDEDEGPPPRTFDFELPMPLVRPQPTAAHPRNAPCPCGSGKKYKQCHEAADQAGRGASEEELRFQRQRLDAKLARHGERKLDRALFDELGEMFAESPDDDDVLAQLVIAMALYDLRRADLDGRTVAEDYVASGAVLEPGEAATLEAQARSGLSLWQVIDVEPGQSLGLRDLFTGEERTCLERSGSHDASRWQVILGRVVDFPESSQLYGMYARPLPTREGEELAEALRQNALGLEPGQFCPSLRMRDAALRRVLVIAYSLKMRELFESPLPALQTTTGEPMLLTSDRFELVDPKLDREAILERLIGAGFERESDDSATVVLLDADTGDPMGRTLLGRVQLDSANLTSDTSSIARADRVRGLIEGALGDAVAHRLRSHADPMAGLPRRRGDLADRGPRPANDVSNPMPELPEALRAEIAKRAAAHWADWCDHPLPALGGETPRQAAAGPQRPQLARLLREFESKASRQPDPFAPDVARLRTELGLDPDER